jgi:hypothetical protein
LELLLSCHEFLQLLQQNHQAIGFAVLISHTSALHFDIMPLFRRLTSFTKSKKNGEEGKADGVVNGTKTSVATQPSTAAKSNTTNGYAPAVVKEEEPKQEEPKREVPKQEVPKQDMHAVTRADVASIFEQYAQLIHASLRPLPNQSGDGVYLEKVNPGLKGYTTGLYTDICTG